MVFDPVSPDTARLEAVESVVIAALPHAAGKLKAKYNVICHDDYYVDNRNGVVINRLNRIPRFSKKCRYSVIGFIKGCVKLVSETFYLNDILVCK